MGFVHDVKSFLGDDLPIGEIDDLYLSWDEVPVDEVQEEGDNSVLANAPWANPGAATDGEELQKLVNISPLVSSPVYKRRAAIVPHPRDLRYKASGGYMRGPDVQAVDRALWRAGVFKRVKAAPFRKAYGPGMRDHVKRFQARKGLKVDGVYGLATHRKLAPYYDAYAIKLVNSYRVPQTPAQKIVTGAMIAYNYRARIHYTQSPARMYMVRNRIPANRIAMTSSIWEDCSSFATWLYWQAGLPDPNGLGYNGQGYTGTMAVRGRRVWTDGAPVGSFSFYGGGFPYGHMVIRIGKNRIISHGNESGPNVYESPYYRRDLRQTRVYF